MTGREIRREAVAEELSTIADFSRSELVELWEKTYECSAPKGISRRLLEYSAAYTAQANAHGGLKASVRRQLAQPVDVNGASRGKKQSQKTALSVGARLVRDWHGRTYTVDVVEDGFRYHGRGYASLSQIAREITGARWSGPRFFGL